MPEGGADGKEKRAQGTRQRLKAAPQSAAEQTAEATPRARKRARKNEQVEDDCNGDVDGVGNCAAGGGSIGVSGREGSDGIADGRKSLSDALFGSPAGKGGSGASTREEGGGEGHNDDEDTDEGSENNAAVRDDNDDAGDDIEVETFSEDKATVADDGDEEVDSDDPEEIIPPKPSPSKLGLFDPESSSAFADRAKRMRKSNMLLAKGGGGAGVGAANASKVGTAGADKPSPRRSSSTHMEVDIDKGEEEEDDSYGDEDEDEDEDDYGDYEDDYGDYEDDEEEEREKMMAVAAIAAQNAREARAKSVANDGGSSGGAGCDVEEDDYDYSDDYDDSDEDDDDDDDDDEFYREYYCDEYGNNDLDSPSPRQSLLRRGGTGKKFGPDDYSDEAVLYRRSSRRLRDKNAKAESLIGFDINRDINCPDSWRSGEKAGVAASAMASTAKRKSGVGLSSLMDEEDAENERARAATAAIETVFQEIGVIVLKSGRCVGRSLDSKGNGSESDGAKGIQKSPKEAVATTEAKTKAGSPSSPVEIMDDSDDDNGDSMEVHAKSKSALSSPSLASASVSESAKVGNCGSEVEFVCSKKAPDQSKKPPVHLIPPHLMEKMVEHAKRIEKEVCDRLDEKGEPWRPLPQKTTAKDGDNDNADGDEKKDEDEEEENLKMPSRETAAKEQARKKSVVATDGNCNFRFREVASRCPGRLDVRHRMDQPPFNDPRIIRNPVLFPIVQSLLGGQDGGAQLVYAGLIFSFPGSSDQPWHMDGAALFPELRAWLDLPPYALNVFLPIDDVTDEVGPTEFLPASHLAGRAGSIDDDLLQWAVAESRRQALASAAAVGINPPHHLLGGPSNKAFSEEEWMSRHSVFAPLMKRGDALIYDYRTCHRGTRNLSTSGRTRTMLYLMYARPWFREHLNFGTERLFDDKDEGRGKGDGYSERGGSVVAEGATATSTTASAQDGDSSGAKTLELSTAGTAASAVAMKLSQTESGECNGASARKKPGQDESNLGDGKYLI